jgi:putative salt-induced outer membrane protein YdiY
MKTQIAQYTLAAGLALAVTSAFGQITAPTVTTPPAELPPPPPPPKWESNVKLGFAYSSGNSDTLLFTGSIATERKGPKDEWAFGADGAYGENNGTVNNQLAHGFGQYNHLFSDRFYAYGRVDALYDGMSDISYRILLSPGAGYYVIKNTNTLLSFEVGPGYVWEKKGGIIDNYFTIRFAEKFEQKLNDKAKLWESVAYLPQVTEWGNYQLVAQVGIEAMIAKSLALNIIASDIYNSQPAAGKEPNDFMLTSGVTYKF